VNVLKECVDRCSEFISESSGEIPLFSSQLECKTSIEAVQGVRKLLETLELTN
jgi:hypothetical protein